MSKISRMLMVMAGVLFCLLFSDAFSMTTAASNSKDCLDDLNVGVAVIIDPSAYDNDANKQAVMALQELVKAKEEEKRAESDLFMADVQVAMNVREEPTEESAKVGLLYKDCGGRILERGDGWTRIKSGDLVGWACNDYLVFGEDAENMANEVGFQIAVVQADALRLRREPSEDAKVVGLIAKGESYEVAGEPENGWVPVIYDEDEQGYVSEECVSLEFRIDAGETMVAIEKRKKEEEEAKRKAALTANRGAIVANADKTRLLAALIQCEAGTVSEEGMLAVGAVVMNRVRSGAYPNTISGVIYASGQFTPALNGKVAARYNGTVHEACIRAAQRALNGETNVGGATHFKRAGKHDGMLIGGNVFW